MEKASPNFPHQNKGFINYVFCRNWAVRNHAGTRLDSSLVNKQVGLYLDVFFVFQELGLTKFVILSAGFTPYPIP